MLWGIPKNEQWNISYEGIWVIIRAVSNNKLVRMYQGSLQRRNRARSANRQFNHSTSGKIVVDYRKKTSG